MEAKGPAKGRFDVTWAAPSNHDVTRQRLLAQRSRDRGGDYGPCLYFGPRGQRCDQRALEGGYCASHRAGAISLPKAPISKRTLAAIIAIAGVLWPVIADLVREIVHWMHSH